MITILNKKPERRRILIGERLDPTGHNLPLVLPISHVKFHLRAPVVHDGKAATLYFENYKIRSIPMNLRATELFSRLGFHIHGPATLATTYEIWHCLRVLGDQAAVQQQIAHLSLGNYAVVPTSRRNSHQEIVARSSTDLMLIKVALWT
jgi:hypothetical protein